LSLKKSKSDPALDTGSTAEQTPAAADASTPEERRSTRTKGTMDARRTEKKLSRNKLMTKGAFLTAAAVILLMAILFAASALLNFEGSFTIKLVSPQSGGKAIALSETMGFANPVVKLEAMPINEMDNITYDWLPLDELDRHDGSYNGENYIAYTFYICGLRDRILTATTQSPAVW